MNESQSHPWLHQKFMEGHHAVTRTEKHFSSVSTDMVIEQTLMRSIKSRGGLTNGRGMSENVRDLCVGTQLE